MTGFYIVLIGIAIIVFSFIHQDSFFMLSPIGKSLVLFGIFFLIFSSVVNKFFWGSFKPHDSLKSASKKMESMASFLKEQNRMNKLSASGQPVKVKIISLRDTGQLVNFDPVLEFNLEVLHEKKEDDYIVNNHQQLVSKIIISRIIPGNIYQAKVDPNDKNNVYISWL